MVLRVGLSRFLVLPRKLHFSAPRKCSALFVSALRAKETTAILLPSLNFEEKLKNIEELKSMLAIRGRTDIDVEKLKESWEFLENVKATKLNLEQKRQAKSKELHELLKDQTKNEKEIKPLTAMVKMLKENFKSMSKEIAALEENVVLKYLHLPNKIHPKTPLDKSKIAFNCESWPLNKLHPALENFQDAGKGDVTEARTHLELFLTSLCYKNFEKDYVKTSNCDFVKSVVAEGCCLKHRDPKSLLILQSEENNSPDSNLHLVGGASRAAFCALFTKSQISVKDLPLKMITVGRQYFPEPETASPNQTTAAELFALVENSREKEYDVYLDILEDVKKLYNSLLVGYRFVSLSGSELKSWESLSTAIEIYSERRKEFVRVGFVSLCGSFISERLLMKYKQDKTSDFPNIITGTVMDFEKVESCFL
ncbi:serine--tRNA synthetase-like protein Slimp [Neocloeon triangulifer]|uniref:serine--tRNA synthetase-like protein Slimp n=1 Tax=Neocloeon triangulifer TaxID=2078957 RepID=UPI00286F188C|nr:serine--tRNA synthetase-like protein Slimp [Neocloeon triangulifer]